MATSIGASEMHVNSEKVQDVLEVIRCPVCTDLMVSKIYTCVSGHNVCSGCRNKLTECPVCRALFSGARNYTVEQLVKCFEYPCENFDAGCQEKLTISLAEKHKNTCLYRKYSCFSRELIPCTWSGRYPDIQPHILEKHGISLSTSKDILLLDKGFSNVSSGHSDYLFINKYDDLFVFYYNRVPNSGKMFFVVQYIGPTDYVVQYQYKITLSNEVRTKEFTFKCNVHTDCETVAEIHKSGECAMLDYETAKQFLRYDNTLQYILSVVRHKK